MEEVKVVKNAQSDFEVLHELTRKELVADLIFDCLFDAVYLDSKYRPSFNSYDLKDGLLLNLMEKYDKKRFDEVMAKLKEEKERENE